MPAYVVVEVAGVTDPERYGRYQAAAGPSLAQAGGRLVWVGRNGQALEGDWSASAVAVLEFPSAEAARGWYAGEAYQAAKPLRAGAATVRMTLMEEPPAPA